MYYFGECMGCGGFFWVFLWILFFSFMMPIRRTTYRQMQSPLQLLQRRYAPRNHRRGLRRTPDQTPARRKYEIAQSLSRVRPVIIFWCILLPNITRIRRWRNCVLRATVLGRVRVAVIGE